MIYEVDIKFESKTLGMLEVFAECEFTFDYGDSTIEGFDITDIYDENNKLIYLNSLTKEEQKAIMDKMEAKIESKYNDWYIDSIAYYADKAYDDYKDGLYE